MKTSLKDTTLLVPIEAWPTYNTVLYIYVVRMSNTRIDVAERV